MTCSVVPVHRGRRLEQPLLSPLLHPLVVLANVEEVLAGDLARRVIRVQQGVALRVDRLLDVPEVVVGDRVQNLDRQRGLESVLVGVLQVLDVVVLRAALEDRQFFVEHVVPLVQRQVVGLDFFQ